MTKKDFKVFLAANELDQKRIAKMLGITEATIVNYNNNNRYPVVFQYAIKAIESELNTLKGSK